VIVLGTTVVHQLKGAIPDEMAVRINTVEFARVDLSKLTESWGCGYGVFKGSVEDIPSRFEELGWIFIDDDGIYRRLKHEKSGIISCVAGVCSSKELDTHFCVFFTGPGVIQPPGRKRILRDFRSFYHRCLYEEYRALGEYYDFDWKRWKADKSGREMRRQKEEERQKGVQSERALENTKADDALLKDAYDCMAMMGEIKKRYPYSLRDMSTTDSVLDARRLNKLYYKLWATMDGMFGDAGGRGKLPPDQLRVMKVDLGEYVMKLARALCEGENTPERELEMLLDHRFVGAATYKSI